MAIYICTVGNIIVVGHLIVKEEEIRAVGREVWIQVPAHDTGGDDIGKPDKPHRY